MPPSISSRTGGGSWGPQPRPSLRPREPLDPPEDVPACMANARARGQCAQEGDEEQGGGPAPRNVQFAPGGTQEDLRPSYGSGGTACTVRSVGPTRTSRSMVHRVATAVSRSPVVVANHFLESCCRKKRWQLGISLLCGVVAVYVHSSSRMSEWLFGRQWERSWLWWCVAVPMYVYLAIYFARFLGSYLVRTWLKEISESPLTHRAMVTMIKGIVEDEEFADILAGFLDRDAVVDSISGLTAAILSSPDVRNAAAGTTASVILDERVTDAGIEASVAAMQSPKLHESVEGLLQRKELTAPLAMQVARILDDSEVREAAAGLIHGVLDDDEVKDVMHLRAASIVGDKEVVEAGRKGFVDAFFGGFSRDREGRATSLPVSRGNGRLHSREGI